MGGGEAGRFSLSAPLTPTAGRRGSTQNSSTIARDLIFAAQSAAQAAPLQDRVQAPTKASTTAEALLAEAAAEAAAPAAEAAEADYGGPITAPNVTLPENATLRDDIPMATLPDGAAPSKELAVQTQPVAPGVDGVGPTSVKVACCG